MFFDERLKILVGYYGLRREVSPELNGFHVEWGREDHDKLAEDRSLRMPSDQ